MDSPNDEVELNQHALVKLDKSASGMTLTTSMKHFTWVGIFVML